MMNSVGGSVIHYGAWLRRFHPHHFRTLSHVKEQWGTSVLPEGCRLADWPVSYEELEPFYTRLEHEIGVAGDESNPFVSRSKPLPMQAMRPFRLGNFFSEATRRMGLHPHPVAVGVNTMPYGGRPATTNTAWSNGFGSCTGDKWDPSLTAIPEALATGNFDLRTGCRVIRILTDRNGHAGGVEYVDPLGRRKVQAARTVILAAYTFENLRLLFLSGDDSHPGGLGNNRGQLGRYFMTKMFAHVDGFFPETNFNRHTGPAAQGVVLDDYLAGDFDSIRHGFVGGATLGAEQQFLPIQISREALPPTVRRWGKPYKDHIRQWQHFGVVRIQPDTLSYDDNFIDIDPHHCDRSGLGMPLVRITYDMRANEQRLAAWMETKAEEILREMGATATWRGPRFTGVGSSHDFGGARIGEDPGVSVVDPQLQVHDTPGLYVFSGAAFPTCPGINPTLTLLAVCVRAAEQLLGKLGGR
jgi:gluconate 2-dehydrogenase alpha chain